MENNVLKSGQQSQFLKGKGNEAKVNNDIDEIETIKIELKHSVAKLLAENKLLHKEKEHLKQTYKDLFDSIKTTRVETKNQNDSLMAQLNKKSNENADVLAQIQKKGICVFNANHDSCVTKFLKEVNSRAKVPSNKTTNRNKPVEQIRVATKPNRQIPTGHRFSIKRTSTVHEKTTSPRSCLRWQPTGRILKTVCLRWVPTGKIFTSSTTKVDSEPPNGSKEDITNQCESEQALDVSAYISENRASRNFDLMMDKWCLLKITLQAPFLNVQKTFDRSRSSLGHQCQMTSVHISSGLVLHQMTSDHNRSELGIQDHSNEPSSSKLVPKVVPLAVKTATSRQELELLFHLHIAMLRTTGINPMIQPEPEDLPKDNPKLEIAVLRIHKDGDGDASFQLESDSLPHAHAHSTKTFYKHQIQGVTKLKKLKQRLPHITDIQEASFKDIKSIKGDC
ncbi:hypothetical protein Tco_1353479 [Tanacetum coccineum]